MRLRQRQNEALEKEKRGPLKEKTNANKNNTWSPRGLLRGANNHVTEHGRVPRDPIVTTRTKIRVEVSQMFSTQRTPEILSQNMKNPVM